MNKVIIECDTNKVSDGYHTFGELYEHRIALYGALMSDNQDISWMSKLHNDGSSFDGWFIAGMSLPTGEITYHLPERIWETLEKAGIKVLERAPEWDGHTSNNVVHRLEKYIATKHV